MSTTWRAGAVALASDEKGGVRGLPAPTGVTYDVGDALPHQIEPRAFTASLRKSSTVPLFWSHNWTTDGVPIGSATASEGGRGLEVDGRLYLDTDAGLAVHRAMRDGAIREWSIGYRITKFEDRDGVRHVLAAELIEVSVVLRGANPETETLLVTAAQKNTPPSVDAIAKKTGLTRVEATRSPSPGIADIERRESTRSRIEKVMAESHAVTASLPEDIVHHANYGVGAIHRAWDDDEIGPILRGERSMIPAHVATLPDARHGHPGFLAEPSFAPLGGAGQLMALVQTIVAEEGHQKVPREGLTAPTAAATPSGDLLPQLPAVYSGQAVPLARYGLSDEETASALDSAGVARDVVETALRNNLTRSLARDILTGSGANGGPFGLDGSAAFDVSGTGKDPIDAIAQAAVLVGGAGFDGGLTVIGHPATLYASVFGAALNRRVRDPKAALPFITNWIPVATMPTGQFIVGDMSMTTLFVKDLRLAISVSHDRNFTQRLVTFVLELQQYFHIQHPEAFAHVTGIGLT